MSWDFFDPKSLLKLDRQNNWSSPRCQRTPLLSQRHRPQSTAPSHLTRLVHLQSKTKTETAAESEPCTDWYVYCTCQRLSSLSTNTLYLLNMDFNQKKPCSPQRLVINLGLRHQVAPVIVAACERRMATVAPRWLYNHPRMSHIYASVRTLYSSSHTAAHMLVCCYSPDSVWSISFIVFISFYV